MLPPDRTHASALTRGQWRTLTTLGALAVGLTVLNTAALARNRVLQTRVATRALLIQQTIPLEQLQQDLARALVDLGMRQKDQQLLDLLAANGITINPDTTGATANAAPNQAPNAAPNSAPNAAPGGAPAPARP